MIFPVKGTSRWRDLLSSFRRSWTTAGRELGESKVAPSNDDVSTGAVRIARKMEDALSTVIVIGVPKVINFHASAKGIWNKLARITIRTHCENSRGVAGDSSRSFVLPIKNRTVSSSVIASIIAAGLKVEIAIPRPKPDLSKEARALSTNPSTF